MKILYIIFGTRPEYLKLKYLFMTLRSNKIPFHILYITQHPDLIIDEPHTPLIIVEQPALSRLSNLGSSILQLLDKELDQCSHLLVQGDTATVFYSALAAFQKHIPIFHLEAGLRTYDLENPFPEEGYRSMISRIATYHLCPDESSKQNLLNEHVDKNLFVVGNTILDLVMSYGYIPVDSKKVIITIHRRENWNVLPSIIEEITNLAKAMPSLEFIWITHPNPMIQSTIQMHVEKNGVPENLKFIQPLPHSVMTSHIVESTFIITDSGGIQEEASFLGKHCYVLRELTERSAIPKEYITILRKPSELQYIISSKNHFQCSKPCYVYGNGDASEQIVKIYNQVLKNTSHPEYKGD